MAYRPVRLPIPCTTCDVALSGSVESLQLTLVQGESLHHGHPDGEVLSVSTEVNGKCQEGMLGEAR